jgi:hypothetical protein
VLEPTATVNVSKMHAAKYRTKKKIMHLETDRGPLGTDRELGTSSQLAVRSINISAHGFNTNIAG